MRKRPAVFHPQVVRRAFRGTSRRIESASFRRHLEVHESLPTTRPHTPCFAKSRRGYPTKWQCDILLRSEEHTSELQSLTNLVCRLLLEKKKKTKKNKIINNKYNTNKIY